MSTLIRYYDLDEEFVAESRFPLHPPGRYVSIEDLLSVPPNQLAVALWQ